MAGLDEEVEWGVLDRTPQLRTAPTIPHINQGKQKGSPALPLGAFDTPTNESGVSVQNPVFQSSEFGRFQHW